MKATLYTASIPVLSRHLRALLAILDKASEYCAAKKCPESAIVDDRLFPDMNPFAFQIRQATDHARAVATRVAAAQSPAFSDDETTIAQFKDRIERTIAFLESVPASAFEGGEAKEIVFMQRGAEHKMSGLEWILARCMPNFFFHYTTAYAILRHRGLEIGKRDFMGPPLRVPAMA